MRKDWRFRIGMLVSVAWLLWAGYRLYLKGALPTDLNSQGDFFAGYFAPLAFLWLVLGYMQQGEELRAQAEELQKSVEHQAELSKATRDQVNQQAAVIEEERQRWRSQQVPQFFVSPLLESTGSHGCALRVEITNEGGRATNFIADLTDTLKDKERHRRTVFKTDDKVSYAFTIPQGGICLGTLIYNDPFGERHEHEFSVMFDGTTPEVTQPSKKESKMVFTDKS